MVVLGRKERLVDLPEFNGSDFNRFDLNARFFDFSSEKKVLVVAEENVMGNPNANGTGSCEVIRELARALYFVCGTRPVDTNWNNRGREVQQYELRVKRLDVQFDEKLRGLYDGAMSRNLWKGTPAVHDRIEYWDQGVLAYFGATGQQAAPNDAPHPITTRALLEDYDPGLYALVEETMAYQGHVDWNYGL